MGVAPKPMEKQMGCSSMFMPIHPKGVLGLALSTGALYEVFAVIFGNTTAPQTPGRWSLLAGPQHVLTMWLHGERMAAWI